MITLITGCRSGFGLLAAETIARAGHTVYAGLRDLSTADALRERTAGLDVTPLQLDVTDPEQREQAVAAIEAKHGAVGALINFGVAYVVSHMTAAPPEHIQHIVEDIRVPHGAGEAISH